MVATCCNFIHLVCCFSRIPAIFSRSWQWEVRGFNGLTQSCQCTIRTAGYTASMRHNVSNDQIMCQSFVLRTVWSAPSLGCYVCLTSKSKALNGLSAFLDHFLATFDASRCLRATFWLVNLYQSLSSAVPSVVPPFWNAKVPRCIRDMDPGHSHQNSSDAKIEGLSISHYPCFGTFSLFVSSACQLCFAMMCLLQMTYDRFLSNRIRNCCCTLIPEWLRGRIPRKWNHDELWTMNPWKELQDSIGVCAKSNYENTKDIKRYCNWNTHVQHQKGHGVAPDGKTSQPRSPHISKGSYAATRGELWTNLKMTDQHTAEVKAKWRKKQTVAWEMTWGYIPANPLKSPKSPPSSDLTWPKHLPHCEPSKGQFWSSFSEHNLFKSPLALVHFLWVSRHIPPEDWLHGNQPLPTNCQKNKV